MVGSIPQVLDQAGRSDATAPLCHNASTTMRQVACFCLLHAIVVLIARKLTGSKST